MRVRAIFHTETVAELTCLNGSLGFVARGRFLETKNGAGIAGNSWVVLGFEDQTFKTFDAAAQALRLLHANLRNWEEALEIVAKNEYAIDIRRGERSGRKRRKEVKPLRHATRAAKKDARLLGRRVIISKLVQPIGPG